MTTEFDQSEMLNMLSACNELTEDYKRDAVNGNPRALKVAYERINSCVQTHTCPNTVMCSMVLKVFQGELSR
ncbi:hypothetical protein [Magnetospira sp. QH-2]|uniref:hypothetical protein n=1 Tax=Magnetospira sp. (strain QH-2) TaxID=1288970 RepID=UPI0005F9F01A|nr:hypothetical protein [Magnetospira sp. QH-2]